MSDTHPVVLITGSARRIGAAIARQFHACGWSVVLHANTSSAELQQAAFDFDNVRPGSVLALQADLRDADALADLVIERFEGRPVAQRAAVTQPGPWYDVCRPGCCENPRLGFRPAIAGLQP